MKANLKPVERATAAPADSKLLALEAEIDSTYARSRDGQSRKAEELIARMWKLPARTTVGRAAKVRIFLRHVASSDFASSPTRDLDWDDQLCRLLLLEFAGMTEADLVALIAA